MGNDALAEIRGHALRCWVAGIALAGGLVLVALSPIVAAATPAPLVHHRLEVGFDPEDGRIRVSDTLRVAPAVLAAGRELSFALHAGLTLELPAGVEVSRHRSVAGERVPAMRYTLRWPDGAESLTLRYAGHLRHGPAAPASGRDRGAMSGAGTIGPEGVYLDGASLWYPRVGEYLVGFELAVELPAGWQALSQGTGTSEGPVGRWREVRPQDDIYLVAAPWTAYRRDTPQGEALVLLREPDAELARRYLAATARYLALYDTLVGAYPYDKFAVVENFWETGFGMPSFTLLGPRVIRLPFIVHTSLPHEILHNWWGNGVYVDTAGGNWAEGLTAYLADHWLSERAGRDAAHRRDALQKYADYVGEAEDFPLREFRGRHSEASMAVGYNKSMMVFHMLRARLGDEAFFAGLRRFYLTQRFRRAGYDELRRAWETVSGVSLEDFFAAWLARPGAPRLALEAVTAAREKVRVTLRQVQSAAPFPLRVPVEITPAGDGPPVRRWVALDGRETRLTIDVPGGARRVRADPGYDLFRRLAPGELPPSLGRVLGAEALTIVLADDAPPLLHAAYVEFAMAWRAGDPRVTVTGDSALSDLPSDRAVLLLGWQNRFRPLVDRATPAGVEVSAYRARVAGEILDAAKRSVVLAVGHPADPDRGLAWLGASDPAALPGLARKLPHYGKYGYLAFRGQAPDNVLKGQWPAADSALSVTFDQ